MTQIIINQFILICHVLLQNKMNILEVLIDRKLSMFDMNNNIVQIDSHEKF